MWKIYRKHLLLWFVLTLSIAMTIRCSRKIEESAPTLPDEAKNISAQYFDCVMRADASCAARLFHYPVDESEKEHAADIGSVARAVEILTEQFGTITRLAPESGRVAYLEVAAGSANVAYWKAHPRSVKLTYRAKFAKLGDGFVAVELCRITDRWQIRSVHYGLPMLDPRSSGRIMLIFNDLRGGDE